jgi:hypothetical protein
VRLYSRDFHLTVRPLTSNKVSTNWHESCKTKWAYRPILRHNAPASCYSPPSLPSALACVPLAVPRHRLNRLLLCSGMQRIHLTVLRGQRHVAQI